MNTSGVALAYDTNNTEIAIGTNGAAFALGTVANITSMSVDGAQVGRGFVLSQGADTTQITMTMTDGSTSGTAEVMTDAAGHTMNVAQTITVSDIADGGSETLNFANLGIKITLAATAGGSIVSDITGEFTNGPYSIDTATGTGTAILQTGSNQGDETAVSFVNTSLAGGTGSVHMDTLAASLMTFANSGTRENASSLITALDSALGSISSSRATLGAAQNRLQHTIANLGTTSENLSASNARIRDVDVATESSNMAKNQVLEQAGVSVLAQANQLPQLALKLLG
jgi:flagellin